MQKSLWYHDFLPEKLLLLDGNNECFLPCYLAFFSRAQTGEFATFLDHADVDGALSRFPRQSRQSLPNLRRGLDEYRPFGARDKRQEKVRLGPNHVTLPLA
jgi:hypothetical protein